jgi:hypothetical protein
MLTLDEEEAARINGGTVREPGAIGRGAFERRDRRPRNQLAPERTVCLSLAGIPAHCAGELQHLARQWPRRRALAEQDAGGVAEDFAQW